MVIPQCKFSDSWQPATAEPFAPTEFIAWSSVFPGAHCPKRTAAQIIAAGSGYAATATLDLNSSYIVPLVAADSPTNARYEASPFRYRIDNLAIATSVPDNDLVTSQALDQIRELQFRPLLLDGTVVSGSKLRLHYVFPAETDFSMLSDAN